MQLTGPQLHQIQEALLSAFPSKDELSMLARLELEQNLDAIAGGENQRVIIFKLLTWAESNGRVAHLIAAALRQRPGNPLLQQLVQDSRGWGLPTQTTAPLTTRHSPPATIDIFLSYSRQDAQIMQRIYADLRAAGFAVWIDEGLEPGTRHWQAAIEEAIQQARCMVVILTPDAKASPWVNNEIGYAQLCQHPIYPVLAAGDALSAVPIGLINAQRTDIRQGYGAVTTSLLPALRAYLQRARHDSLPRTLLSPSAPNQPSKSVADVWKQPWLWGVLVALLWGIGVESWPYLSGNFDFRSHDSNTATPTAEVAVNEPEPVTPSAVSLPVTESISQTSALSTTTTVTATPTPLPTNTATAKATETATPEPTATPTPLPTATPTLAAGATKVIEIAPGVEMIFVYVPAGEFSMGSPAGVGGDDEHPKHTVDLDAYWIGLTEVTNAQYRPFVEAGGYGDDQWWIDAGWQWRQEQRFEEPEYWQWNDDLQPMVGISWYESYAYTQWLSAQTGLTIRLPTEAQWEKAARGTDGRTYPWGEAEPTAERANFNNLGGTAMVGSYPKGASPYGALDMAGNVWEWTSSLYMEYPYKTDDGRENLESGDEERRVLRGGAFNRYRDVVRCAYRLRLDPRLRGNNVGFRVVAPGF